MNDKELYADKCEECEHGKSCWCDNCKLNVENTNDINCEFTLDIVCPYCGYGFSDSWEWDSEGEEYCENCDNEFSYERIVTVAYSTYKKESE